MFENVPEGALEPRLPVPAATNLREEGNKGGTDAMLEGLSTSSGQRVTTDPGVSVVFKGGD
jgi:hypothetical protein